MSVIHIHEPAGSFYTAGSRPSTGLRALVAAAGAVARRMGTRVLRLCYQAMTEYQVRRAVRELQRLDDRVLRDIGINRSEIQYAVRYGTAHDLGPLAGWPQETDG